jgi:hypothetical protein
MTYRQYWVADADTVLVPFHLHPPVGRWSPLDGSEILICFQKKRAKTF